MNRLSDLKSGLALTGLETRIGLVDNVEAAFAADNFTVAVAVFQGFQRRTDFHGLGLLVWAYIRAQLNSRPEPSGGKWRSQAGFADVFYSYFTDQFWSNHIKTVNLAIC